MASLQKTKWTRALRIHNQNTREFLSEFLGTSILVTFITGAGFQSTLSGGLTTSYFSSNLAGGVGVMMAMYMCGGVSGGCFNPAVSFAMSLVGRLPWTRLPFHVMGQLCGAFVSAGLVYGVYKEALDKFDGGNRQMFGPQGTAGIFCSFPQDYLSAQAGFLDQVVGAGLLIICALAITDKHNLAPAPGLCPIGVGLAVYAIGAGFGFNCGYPINPAKDFGPRLFILSAGWGTEAISHRDYNWFWVPILGPLGGAIVSCFLYWIFIDLHWPDKAEVPEIDVDVSDPPMAKTTENVLYEEPDSQKVPITTIDFNSKQGSVNGGFVGDSDVTRF